MASILVRPHTGVLFAQLSSFCPPEPVLQAGFLLLRRREQFSLFCACFQCEYCSGINSPCLCRGKAVSMGTLTVRKQGRKVPAQPAPSTHLIGPQFPELHMLPPFDHDGAMFVGYQPGLTSSSDRQAPLCSALLLSIALSTFLCRR